MKTLIIFTTPATVTAVLKTDRGDVIQGYAATHPTGRKGIGFDIPDGHPNGNGANLLISTSGYVPVDQRGTLWLTPTAFPWTPGQTAAFVADDFTLSKAGAVLPPLRVQGAAFVQEV